MRFLLTDDDGNLVATYTGAHPAAQLVGRATRVHAAPGAGAVHDGLYRLEAGRLALKPTAWMATPPWTNHVGLETHEVFPGAIAASVAPIVEAAADLPL